MSYFARISSQIRPANRAQTYLLTLVEKHDGVLLDDPEALFLTIQEYARQASRAFPKCARLEAGANRDYKTKELQSIGAGGLFSLSLHKVKGTFSGPIVAKTAPAPMPIPPATLPQETSLGQNQPRQAIHKSREADTIVKFEDFTRFSPVVRQLLESGRVWLVYYDSHNLATAEEYGGKTHPAF